MQMIQNASDIALKLFYGTVLFSAFRYFFFGGIVFLIYYKWFKKKFSTNKIQLKIPSLNDYKREIFYSMITFLIFGLVAAAVFNPIVIRYTRVYQNISDYGINYLFASFGLTLLIHDTYFYWFHRLMHHPKIFKYFHKVHHLSTNPSPWTSFSFHPYEAIIEAGIFIILPLILPLHRYTILAFLTFMTIYNIYGYFGWEWMPPKAYRHWFWKWFNNAVLHNQHHHFYKGNYGLYFTFWDKWMGTFHPNYEKEYDEVKARNDV